jgi:hypothetical protein
MAVFGVGCFSVAPRPPRIEVNLRQVYLKLKFVLFQVFSSLLRFERQKLC